MIRSSVIKISGTCNRTKVDEFLRVGFIVDANLTSSSSETHAGCFESDPITWQFELQNDHDVGTRPLNK